MSQGQDRSSRRRVARGGRSPRGARGFSLLEVMVASTILVVLMGAALSFMGSQMTFGREAQRQAFGNARALRVFKDLSLILRTAVIEQPTSSFTSASNEHFATVKLRPIEATPYVVSGNTIKLDVADQPATLEVVDAAGNPLAQTYDALPAANPPGTLRLRLASGEIRVLADDVLRFRVANNGSYLAIELVLKVQLGREQNGVAQIVSPLPIASGDIPAVAYDPTEMQ
ncbi:MAG: type II secretion system protein [Planctomycetota bacterium]